MPVSISWSSTATRVSGMGARVATLQRERSQGHVQCVNKNNKWISRVPAGVLSVHLAHTVSRGSMQVGEDPGVLIF